MTSSQSFGTAVHAASVDAQNLNKGSSNTKSTVIVVLSPTVNGNQIYRAENSGQVSQTVAQGKALNRVTDLLGMAGDSASILELLGPRGGAEASIDERIKLKDSAAQILRYTVNGDVGRLQKLLSEALFKVAEKAANDNTTLAAYAGRFGVHAIAVTSEANSYDAVRAIVSQLENIERNETKFVPAPKANVDQINAPIINWPETSVNAVLLEGAALSFVVRSESTRVNFLINSIKGNNVSKALDVFKREDQSSVTMEEKVAALEAIEYGLGAMPDEEIAEAYAAERADFLNGAGAAVNNSSEEEEEDSEEESDEEEAATDEEFNASETLAAILLEAQLDRAQLKKLVFLLEGKVFTKDTEETLTVKLLELVEDLEYDQFFQFVLSANEKLGGVSGFAEYLHAESSPVEEEEVEEDHDDESEEDSDEDEGEDGDDEDEDEDDEEGEEFSASAELAELISSDVDDAELSREAIRAIARSDFFQLKTFKNQSAEDILENIFAALNEREFAEVEEFEQMIRSLATIEVVAAHFPSFENYEVNPVDYSEFFLYEGGTLTNEQRIAALESVGVETDGLGMVGVLKAFEAYRLENGYVQAASESDEVAEDYDQDEDVEGFDPEAEDEDAEEADDENFALPASPAGDDSNFVSETSTNEIGTFVRVRQEQTLLVNFTLTDRNTFEGIREELEDQSGVNYLVPFNRNEEVEGSMYLPLTVATDLLSSSASLPFMSDRHSFNVDAYARGLENTITSQLDALIYEGRLEAGQDPSQSGLVLGDFIDDEDEEGFDEDELNSDELSDLVGDHVSMTSLYSAIASVRPVVVGDDSTVLNTVALNIALPCVWGLNAKRTKELVQSAYNRVMAHIGETDIKVYVGFTLNSGSLVADETLRNIVTAVASIASDEIEVSSYSSNDVQRINEADDLVEAAYSIGTENLPLILLSSGVAEFAFANGGDLVLLLSEVEAGSDEDETEE